jgi:hypothetical protein
MLCVSMGVGAFDILSHAITLLPRPNRVAGMIGFLVVATLMFAFIVWLIGKISRGRSWARNLFGIVTILGTVYDCFHLDQLRRAGLSDQVLLGVQTVLQVGITLLLFSRQARLWFRRPTAAASPVAPVV